MKTIVDLFKVLSVLLCLAVSANVWATPALAEAEAALDRGDYRAALPMLRYLALRRDRAAAFYLGVMYQNGQGVRQDLKQAARWFRVAAELGLPEAQFNLGAMYDMGEGVPRDQAEAVKWYRAAAEQGDALAQNNLGVMYQLGEGVEKDLVQALFWSALASAQGLDEAQENALAIAAEISVEQRALVEELLLRYEEENSFRHKAADRRAPEPI